MMMNRFPINQNPICHQRTSLPCALLILLLLLPACARKQTRTADSDSIDTAKAAPEQEEVFHADNDIAMVVKSVSDAIANNEHLDPAYYNFEGVMTDGQGAPLYTDAQGSPGAWQVAVTDDEVAISNLYLGKFNPDDLRHYVAAELGLTEKDIERRGIIKGPDGMELTQYNIPNGELRFELTKAKTASGQEGPMLTIVLRPAQEE